MALSAGNVRAMRVFLHAGFGKTGSSAIQVALARHRPALAAAGLLYPDGATASDAEASAGGISSGNAVRLAWLLNLRLSPDGFSEAEGWAWLEACIKAARGRDLLFSSEIMQGARPERLQALADFLRARGAEQIGILYLRHVLDHAVAAYLQHLKQGFATLAGHDRPRSLHGYLGAYRCPFLRRIREWQAAFGPRGIMIRLYEAERQRLVAGFLDGISEAALLPDSAAGGVVNRSPTAAEAVVFEHLASLPEAPALCRALTTRLLNAPLPAGVATEPPSVAASDYDSFALRNEPIVARLNSRFLPRGPELLLHSGRIPIGAAEPPADAVQEALIRGLAAALRVGPAAA